MEKVFKTVFNSSKKFDVKLVERKRTGIVTTTKIIEKIKSTN